MSKRDQEMGLLAISHLYIKLEHHLNIIAGAQEEFEDMTQDKKDVKEIKRVMQWLLKAPTVKRQPHKSNPQQSNN